MIEITKLNEGENDEKSSFSDKKSMNCFQVLISTTSTPLRGFWRNKNSA